MAIEAERLLAVFEARFTSLEKALTRARGDANKTFADIEKAGTRAENALARVGSRGTPGLTRMRGEISRTRIETSNLAAQFNDIGVQLASGQSPFLIALQQGTQINQALGGAGLRGTVGALGGAFASLLNPVSLATIAVIGLGGAAVQYFTSLLSDGEKSAEVLKREADLINQVAKEWGDTLPAIRAYAEERQKLATQAQLQEATDIGLEAAYAEAREQVRGLNVDVVDLLGRLQDAGAAPEAIARLQETFAALGQAVRDEKGGVEEANAVHAALTSLFDTTAIPATADLAKQFDALAAAIATASANAVQLRSDLAIQDFNARNPLGTIGPVFSSGGQFINESELQTVRANATKSQFQLDQERLAKSRRGGVSEAEREAQAVADLIAQLQFERELVGATALEREKATALRRAGAAATAEQKAQIEQLVTATYNEKEAIKQQEEAYKTLQEVGKTALNSLATALSDGKLEGQELLSILAQVAQQLLSMPSLGGGGGFGGFLSGILGSIFHQGGVVGQGGPKRNVNPAVFAGAPRYHSGGVAGLRPGEVPAILQKGEIVLPKGAGARQASPQQITITLVGEEGEMFTPRVQQISGQTAGVVVRESRPQLSRDAVNAVQTASRNRPGIFRS